MKKGFTLIEVLIVLTIITMLAAVVIIAVNPGRQFAQARNTQRWTAVNSLLNAIEQNMADNNGNFNFSGCTATSLPATSTNMASGGLDLCGCLTPTYIAEMPYDPTVGSYTSCSDYDSGYSVAVASSTTRVTVSAPHADLGVIISVTR